MLMSEIIYSLRSLPRKGDGLSDDDSYSDRQLAFLINSYRAQLIKRDRDKGKYITEYYTQDLGRVPLIKADAHECCDWEPFECVLRIENPLPKVVDSNTDPLFVYVGTVDGKGFQRTNYNKAQFGSYAKYTGRMTKWYQSGDYIYIINPPTKALKYINIQAVFENPTEANEYKTCKCNDGNDDCFVGFNYEYPMSLTDVQDIIKMDADVRLRIANVLPKDELNDSKDQQ